MAHANFPISLWGDALLTTAYILNRVPSKSISTTPYELWMGRRPDLSYIRGQPTMFTVTPMLIKLGPIANKGIFIRYSDESKGYVMLGEQLDGMITKIELRDVIFFEGEFPRKGISMTLIEFLKWMSHMKTLLILIKKMRVTYYLVGLYLRVRVYH